jgi:hypothetical protein
MLNTNDLALYCYFLLSAHVVMLTIVFKASLKRRIGNMRRPGHLKILTKASVERLLRRCGILGVGGASGEATL